MNKSTIGALEVQELFADSVELFAPARIEARDLRVVKDIRMG